MHRLGRGPLRLLFCRLPLQGPFYVILEASSSDAQSNGARLEAFLTAARAAGSGGVLGGSGSSEERQAAAAHIWSVRKNLSEGLRLTGGGLASGPDCAPLSHHHGTGHVRVLCRPGCTVLHSPEIFNAHKPLNGTDRVLKYDLSLAPGEMYELVEDTRRQLADFPESKVLEACVTSGLLQTIALFHPTLCRKHAHSPQTISLSSAGGSAMWYGCDSLRCDFLHPACLQTVGYGHLGDGNLHLNVTAPADGDAVQVRQTSCVPSKLACPSASICQQLQSHDPAWESILLHSENPHVQL